MRARQALAIALAAALGAALSARAQEGAKPPEDGIVRRFEGVAIDVKARRVEVDATICVPYGLLELLACTPHGKTHESLLAFHANPEHIQLGLIMIGLEPKPQVKLFGERKALTEGERVVLWAEWEKGGAVERHRVEDLIYNNRVGRPMRRVGWVFTGSRYLELPPPEMEKDPAKRRKVFAAAYTGNVVATYHDPDCILDTPLVEGGDDEVYWANADVLPPRGTKVKVTIAPAGPGEIEPGFVDGVPDATAVPGDATPSPPGDGTPAGEGG